MDSLNIKSVLPLSHRQNLGFSMTTILRREYQHMYKFRPYHVIHLYVAGEEYYLLDHSLHTDPIDIVSICDRIKDTFHVY